MNNNALKYTKIEHGPSNNEQYIPEEIIEWKTYIPEEIIDTATLS